MDAPERLPVHVLLCDADVRQRFVPNRVQGVSDRLRFQLIGLQHKEKHRNDPRVW